MSKKNSSGVVGNLIWKFGERITAQLVTLVVSIILARILEPSHYGIISLVTIFITIANVFVSDGFGSALIQKKDADELDFYSVLYFNIILSIIVYFVLFFTAPFIAEFYGQGYEILTPVLRVLSLRLIICAINSVQQAYVSRHMIFKKYFWATLFGTIVSAIVGIIMAYNGFGVWALVGQYLTNTFIDTIVLNASLRLKPKLIFSFERIKQLVPYGAGILGTKLLITGYQEIRALLIGKVYSSSDLAFYDKGKQFPNLLVANIDSSISAVLFPKLSKEQDDKNKIRTSTRMSMRFSSYIMSPMMLGLAAVSGTFVKVVLTEKWMPCVPLLRLFCIVYLFMPIHSANMQAIKAIGRSDIYLKLEIIKKVIELIALIIAIHISVEAIVVSMAVLTVLFTFVNAIPNAKLFNYRARDQISDILPSVVMASVMSAAVYTVGLIIPNSSFLSLIIQILIGGGIYLFLSKISNNKEYAFIVNHIRSFVTHK